MFISENVSQLEINIKRGPTFIKNNKPITKFHQHDVKTNIHLYVGIRTCVLIYLIYACKQIIQSTTNKSKWPPEDSSTR